MFVGNYMTPDPVIVSPDTNFPQAMDMIRKHNIRRLPVVDKDRLVGIVVHTDLLSNQPSPATTLSLYEIYSLIETIRMRQIMSIVDSYAYGAWIAQIVIPRFINAADEAKLKEAIPLATTSINTLNDMVGDGPFCCGSDLTLADLHLVAPYFYCRGTPEGQALIADAPNLEKWWAGMSTRPSVEKTTPNLG